MIYNEIKQVDMLHPQSWPVLGDVGHEELDMFPDAKFRLGRVVEDIEGDFVSKALATQELGGNDLGEDLIQTLGQRIGHGVTWIQRRT